MPATALKRMERTASDFGIFRRRVSATSMFFGVEGKKRDELLKDVEQAVAMRREDAGRFPRAAVAAEWQESRWQTRHGEIKGVIVKFLENPLETERSVEVRGDGGIAQIKKAREAIPLSAVPKLVRTR
ncbi:MAG: hypothetical protein V1881_01905 [Candidatus Micrarchaeota archaeon]